MSTGGRVFPSVTGGGLARGTGAVVDAIARRRQEALQLRQLENSERITSLSAVTLLLPHLPIGTTIGDLDPVTQRMVGDALGIDPTQPIFQDAILNRDSVAAFADRITLERLDDLTPEEQAEDEAVRAELGLTPIKEVADVERLRAAGVFKALNLIFDEPARMDDFVDRVQGLDPITITLPDGTTKSFDRGLAAQLFVTMMRDQKLADFRFEQMNDATRQASISQIIDQVALREMAIQAPAVQRVMAVYDRAIEAGDYSIIQAFRDNPGIPQGDKLAMEVLDEGMLFGEAFRFRNLPESLVQLRDLAELVRIMQAADTEELQKIVDELDPLKFGTTREAFFFRIGAPTFILPPGEVGTRAEAEARARAQEARDAGGGALVPTVEEQITAVLENLDVVPRATLVERTSEEIVALAETRRDVGGVDVDAVDPDAEPAAEPTVISTLSEDQQGVVELQQSDLAELERLFAQTTAPRGRASLNSRIGRLRADIALNSTVLPIQTEDVVREGQVTIPAGGIDPANMPATARTAVLQLNILIRRLENITRGQPQREALEFAINRQKLRLRRILAQG